MDWSNLQKDYERLGSFAAVAEEYGVSRSWISQKVKEQGWHQKDWSQLPALYQSGMTYEQLAERYDCSLSTIGNRLRSMGIQPEHRGMRGKTWTADHRANFMASIEQSDAQHNWSDERRANHRAATTDNPEWRAENEEHLRRTRQTRRPSTNSPSEIKFQQALIDARLSFETQAPLLNRYNADVLLHQAPIIIEVDGWSHKFRKDSDARRDAALTRAGYQIFRFTNDQVDSDAAGCVRQVMEKCGLQPEADPVAIIRDRRTGMIREENPNWGGGPDLHDRICENCGEHFLAATRNGGKEARFCKYDCYWEWMRGRPRDERSGS